MHSDILVSVRQWYIPWYIPCRDNHNTAGKRENDEHIYPLPEVEYACVNTHGCTFCVILVRVHEVRNCGCGVSHSFFLESLTH